MQQTLKRRGLDMDPEVFLELWYHFYVESPAIFRAEMLSVRTGSWRTQYDIDLDAPVSRQIARSIAAIERLWGRIEGEFGMLTGEEVAQRVGLSHEELERIIIDRDLAIGVIRDCKLSFPGFQFDPETRLVRPVIKELIQIGAEHNLDMEELTLLMVNPSTYFEGDSRPVDHLDDPGLPDTIRQMLSVEW